MNLNKKLLSILLVITIALVFSVVIYLGRLQSADEEMIDNLLEDIRIQTDAATIEIHDILVATEDVVKQVAMNPNVRRYLAEVDIHSHITTNPLYQTVSDTLVDYNNSFDKLVFVWIANDRANFFIDNTLVVSHEGYVASDRPWYDLALNNEGVVFAEPYTGIAAGAVIVPAITSLNDETGKNFGFVAADVSLDAIPEIMERYKIGENGKNFLISKDGTLIYAYDVSYFSRDNNIKAIPELASFVEDVLEGQTGNSEVFYDNKDYIVAYQPLHIAGWGIIQLIDIDEVYDISK